MPLKLKIVIVIANNSTAIGNASHFHGHFIVIGTGFLKCTVIDII